ncbi:MAG: cell division protein FtsA [Salinivirgaceae bacterium]|nr:cell division protein FtsA [Salinivirgaceae bacterium]
MEQQNENIIAAIDVGTTKIVALVGQKDSEGHIEVIGYGRTESKGVRRGAVLNIEEATNSIRTAVQQAEAQSGYKITEAYVGIAGQHIRSQRFTQTKNRNWANDAISQNDVDALINQMREVPTEMGEEVLHILPQKYKVDDEDDITNPVGISGKKLEGDFHIVFGQMAAANNLRRCVEKNGIKVKRLILEPLASATAVLSSDDKELGVALVDIGGGTTDVAVFKNGQIFHTAVIPFGGDIITSDIKEGCKILERQAESLKVQCGQAIVTPNIKNKVVAIPGSGGLKPKEISLDYLAMIIQARMNEIIATVKQILESAGVKDSLGAGVVLTGGGAMLRHITHLFAYGTALEPRIGVPSLYIKSKIEAVTTLPSNATSIGLLMMGFDNNLNDGINNSLRFEKDEKVNETAEAEFAINEKPAEGKKEKPKKGKAIEKITSAWNTAFDWLTTVEDKQL